jgi:hypothetical protein
MVLVILKFKLKTFYHLLNACRGNTANTHTYTLLCVGNLVSLLEEDKNIMSQKLPSLVCMPSVTEVDSVE